MVISPVKPVRKSRGRFNIGVGLAEPAIRNAASNHRKGVEFTPAGGRDRIADAMPASRTLDLTSDRAADRYIRKVLQTRARMAEYQRWMLRQSPALAGGAVASPVAGSGQGIESNPASAATAQVPFSQASKRGIEQGPSWTVTLGAGTQTLGPVGLPAQGYLRAVEIDIRTATVGVIGAGVLAADGPANILQTVRFQDTNGNQLDDLPGYGLLQDNVFGGYAGNPDPRFDVDYSNTVISPSLQLLLARELAPNGFGAIANMSASQAYKLTLRIAALSEVYSVAPTLAPVLLISTWMHFWQQPDTHDLSGREQQVAPPFHGTTQYRWYAPANAVAQAFNLQLTQTGNEIRNLILIGRNNSGVRTNAVFPEPLQLRWDTEMLVIAGQRQLRKIAHELVAGITGLDAGVLPIPFNFGEGRFVGGSGINSWLPTVTSTRLQITGTQEASTPGTIDVFTNDVSVAETNPALRPATPGPGGYTPAIAPRA